MYPYPNKCTFKNPFNNASYPISYWEKETSRISRLRSCVQDILINLDKEEEPLIVDYGMYLSLPKVQNAYRKQIGFHKCLS